MPKKQILTPFMLRFHSVPLHHHTNLKSNVVSGQVVVGVRSTLSVQFISFLFGIDLAGGKVVP
jgi:hypothetical protein